MTLVCWVMAQGCGALTCTRWISAWYWDCPASPVVWASVAPVYPTTLSSLWPPENVNVISPERRMVVYCLGSTESIKPGEIVHFIEDFEVLASGSWSNFRLKSKFQSIKIWLFVMKWQLKFVTTLYQNTFNSI